jgi:glutathione S-transferase
MKLYFFPVAPNPTKVRLYLAEKRAAGADLAIEEQLVDLVKGEQRSAAHLQRNSRGALPVLELDDGSHLTESLAIIEYVEELMPRPSMLGATPLERARVREIERIVDLGVLIAAARVVHATRSPIGLPPSPEVASQSSEALSRTFAFLNEKLADGRPFLAGDAVSVADCTLAAGLQFGRFGGVALPTSFVHLSKWDARYRERPAAKAVLSV